MAEVVVEAKSVVSLTETTKPGGTMISLAAEIPKQWKRKDIPLEPFSVRDANS